MAEEGIGSSWRKEGEHRVDKHIYKKKGIITLAINIEIIFRKNERL